MKRRQLIINAGIACVSGLLSTTLPSIVKAQNEKQTFYTKGRYLYNRFGEKVILNGINLPILDDWDFPQKDKLAELEKTGANAVRIQWYKDYDQSSRPSYSISDLDNLLTRCRESQIIPIIGLWDVTCNSNPNLLNTQLIPWWTNNEVLNVLKKHESYLIINLANELGFYRWTDNQKAALNRFKNAYKNAIISIRQYLHLPIMIDAPDCGTSIEAFSLIGKELIAHDPDHNLLFSGHAYWSDYDGIPHIESMIKANIPLVFGEIANKQDENINGTTKYCYYDLDGTTENRQSIKRFTYQALLPILKQEQIGWMAWCWWKDNCTNRQMTLNGKFSNLTSYGDDLVNNPIYGLKIIAKRTR
ncbi:MAG: cellulase family glycosylhydrolase [Aulosira sp. ZfuVER01]|nr:cellulase family glycosylhydrolase [Aulosira sp. ZfuVER01]MDZ7998160.1 cellulase family glycosylhydrolase [Aulosira sp. DedVER01a]MDZ8051084.1 cellulase family glycosylhydrolase [Aulosira sp. ZfuCHP01]